MGFLCGACDLYLNFTTPCIFSHIRREDSWWLSFCVLFTPQSTAFVVMHTSFIQTLWWFCEEFSNKTIWHYRLGWSISESVDSISRDGPDTPTYQMKYDECKRPFRRKSDKKRHKYISERQSEQRGAVQCTVCHRWFRSCGGLSVHSCRPGQWVKVRFALPPFRGSCGLVTAAKLKEGRKEGRCVCLLPN